MKLRLAQDGDWVVFKATSSFGNVVRLGIMPDSYRQYDVGIWRCHKDRVPQLIGLAKKFYSEVDTNSIPSAWLTGEVEIVEDYYSKLFLTSEAPTSVVKLVYENLMSLYHPDHNEGVGDSTRLQEVLTAYREIIKQRKS